MQVFGHRDADVQVQWVRNGAAAGDDELARQHAFRHAYDGTRRPRERDERGNVADFRRERRAEAGAFERDFTAGKRGRGTEGAERRHGVSLLAWVLRVSLLRHGGSSTTLEPEQQQVPHGERHQARGNVVEHDAGAAVQALKLGERVAVL